MLSCHLSLLEAALQLHKLGFRPIPVRSNAKIPLISWKVFQERPPTEDEIRNWFDQRTDLNLAIITGAGSGVDVIDVDVNHGDWPAPGNSLPDGCVVRTPSGGLHLYVRHIAGARNSTGSLAKGIDVRADGGCCLVPPSSIDGNSYCFIHGSFSTVPEAPQWLKAELLNGHSHKSPAPEAAAGKTAAGQRNVTLTSIAGSLRRRGMTESAILAALLEENAQRCDPPLDQSEVERIASRCFGVPSSRFFVRDSGHPGGGQAGILSSHRRRRRRAPGRLARRQAALRSQEGTLAHLAGTLVGH